MGSSVPVVMEVTHLILALVAVVSCQDNINVDYDKLPEDGDIVDGKCGDLQYGRIADKDQCDIWYHCMVGIATVHYCKEGLLFDNSDTNNEKCKYEQEVKRTDCQYVQETDLAALNPRCEKFNGKFNFRNSLGEEENVCDKYIECVDNVPHELPCAGGTVFDASTGNCVRPEERNKDSPKVRFCENDLENGVDSRKVVDGFVCPTEPKYFNGLIQEHPYYKHPDNCYEYFVCYGGKNPNKFGCEAEKYLVFDDVLNKCVPVEEGPDRCLCAYGGDGCPD